MPAEPPNPPVPPESGAPEPGEAVGVEVEALHRAIAREPPEPIEGREPAPWWLWAAAATALFWGGWYLGRHGGTFGVESHLGYAPDEEAAAPGAPPTGAGPTAAAPLSGADIYTQRCASCHQAGGEGLPGVFPPLVGSEWVAGDPAILVRIVLDGLGGPITVGGQPYDGVMPPWRDQLDDAAIAAVLTHERTHAGVDAPPVDPALVTELRAAGARATPWTAAELEALP
ncbi:MAG: cytochrome c [Pseudomonadota bacterium]|nr:cytochrome c [Pseudomonadota bacterium]